MGASPEPALAVTSLFPQPYFSHLNSALPQIPKVIQHFVHLKEINLTMNKISVIPPELCELSNLRKLTLSWNQIVSVHIHLLFLQSSSGRLVKSRLPWRS